MCDIYIHISAWGSISEFHLFFVRFKSVSLPFSLAQAERLQLPNFGVGAWAWGDRLFWGYAARKEKSLEDEFEDEKQDKELREGRAGLLTGLHAEEHKAKGYKHIYMYRSILYMLVQNRGASACAFARFAYLFD